jgi:hypothetical protein
VLTTLKNELFELICTGAELEDIMVRNQCQQLFTHVLTTILDQNLSLREELEVLLVKVVLKPAVSLAKRLSGPETKKTSASSSSSSA